MPTYNGVQSLFVYILIQELMDRFISKSLAPIVKRLQTYLNLEVSGYRDILNYISALLGQLHILV